MKILLALSFIFFLAPSAHAVQKARIVGDVVDVYSDADFDSEVIEEVYKGERYVISSKVYGPFYRIKLKSGKIGYIVDYELDIEGKGPMVPKDFDETGLSRAVDPTAPAAVSQSEQDKEEEEVFGRSLRGPVLQFVNYHEDTMGETRIADLITVGYKSVSILSWSFAATFQVPKYYNEPVGYSAKGFQLWGDSGYSHKLIELPSSDVRLGANLFGHLSSIQVQTPSRSYDLQDVTAGVNLELAWNKKFKSFTTDFSLKYYFDKSNYAAFGMALLF